MDIVERLRKHQNHPLLPDEAADEIERLRGHKEEADRHIATIAQLRHDLAAESERRIADRAAAAIKFAAIVGNLRPVELAAERAAERERCISILRWYARDDDKLMVNDITPIISEMKKGVIRIRKDEDVAVAAERERWQARVSELVAALDKHHGTPCEQIRHKQELAAERERCEARIERLQAMLVNSEATLAGLMARVEGEVAEREVEHWRVDDSGINISHAELCMLSRGFNTTANLADPHHYRINEWLKRQIAAAQTKEND